jgi:hypothetical protein
VENSVAGRYATDQSAISLEPRNKKKPPGGGLSRSPAGGRLLDLGFLELDVLLRNRVVFLEGKLLRLRAAVLARHVEIAGVG